MTDLHVRELFCQRFHEDPSIVAVGPGRINLIGDHTDYNDGFVFPAAIDLCTYVAASVAEGDTTLWSEHFGAADPFDASTVAVGDVSGWGRYPAGMAWAMRSRGKIYNLKAVVTSGVPSSGGVSSSAALEMAFAALWNELGEFGIPGKDLALLGQRCENGFVGVNSGIMDQMASAMGREARAMFLDTRSLEIEYAPIPAGMVAVLLDTQKPRALTDSAYNERRSQCESAAATMGVGKLRDVSMLDLEKARQHLSPIEFKRAHHVISENDRCLEFKESLTAGDLRRLGQLMAASHKSLQFDYEVSCPELDAMAESAWSSPGCIGARMMGAGFGGSCIALVEEHLVDPFVLECLAQYKLQSGRAGAALVCKVGDGARIVP